MDSDEEDEYLRFEKLATTALFEELFKEADNSLKSTLTIQYRMHRSIMRLINPFYENKLQAGLSEQQEDDLKQHGFTIRASAGDSIGERLIVPGRSTYWIDSTFDRNDAYRSEERPKTGSSRINRREVELIEHLLGEIDTQIGMKKTEIDPSDWGDDQMLMHLQKDGRLPVGVISFYLAQKNELRSMVQRNVPKKQRHRWLNLDVRVDTVDRFQGGERPVILCSMVQSPIIEESQAAELKRLLEKNSDPTSFIGNKKGHWKPEKVRGRFIKKPNRLNVAYSRAQNLLIILGNQHSFKPAKVDIHTDSGEIKKTRYFTNLLTIIGKGGVLDGRKFL